MRWLLSISLLFAASLAFGSDIYFAQSAAGGGAGTSCATAESLATFNGGTATAGNTYHLCGTVTGQVTVPACTSGSSSTHCEVLFDSASTGNITAAALSASGAIVLQNYWTIDGGTACGTSGQTANFTSWQTTCGSSLSGTGFIKNTANGTGLANQVATVGIFGSSVHDIEIRNLIINNLYQKTAFISDTSNGAQNTFGIEITGAGNNILIHDVAISMVNTGIYIALTGSSANTQVYKNVVSQNKWGILNAQGSGVSTGTYDYFNDINIGTLWNTDFNNGDPYHTDYLFLFGQNSSVYMTNTYVYGNYLHGAGGSHNTTDGLYYCMSGFIYDNQNQQTQYIFNNVFNLTSGYSCGGAVTTGYSSTFYLIANNTFLSYGASTCNANNGGNTCTANADFGPNNSASTNIENNITSGYNSPMIYNHSGAAGFATVDYNNYFGWDNSGAPWCVGTTASCANSTIYTCFQTSDGNCNFDNGGQANGPWNAVHDQHGNENNPHLTASFHLLNNTSGAWQTGTNLYSTFGCSSPVIPGLGAGCSDAAGVARPSSGSWDMGAYEDSASGGQATSPSCSPGSGTYASTQTVTCTNPNTGTTDMCYTVNGTTPATNGDGATCATGTKYTTTISVPTTQTLQIIAGTSTETDSPLVSYAYLIPIQITYVNASTGNDTFDCSSATFVSAYVGPCLTVARGEAATTAGGTINIAAGTYRLPGTPLASGTGNIIAKANQTFIGPACTPSSSACTAIISGGINLCNATYPCSGPDGSGNYSVTGMTQQGPTFGYTCDSGWSGCNYAEDLFVNGVPLQHVVAASEPTLSSTQWWFDYTNHIIYFSVNPSGKTIDTSVLGTFIKPTSCSSNPCNDITIENLTIEEFATRLGDGCVSPSYNLGGPTTTTGLNWIVENSYITLCHGDGIAIAFGMQALNNVTTTNGNLGIGGGTAPGTAITPSGVLVQGNTVSSNNYAHVSPGFGAGGIKFGNTAYATIRGNTVTNNIGNGGPYFDVNSIGNLVDGNTVTGNNDSVANVGGNLVGEIGELGGTFRNNYVQNISPTSGAYASSTSAGLQAYCNVLENTSATSSGGYTWKVLAGVRGNNTVQPNLGSLIVSTGNYVHHNTIIVDPSGVGQTGFIQNDTTNQPNFFANNTAPDFNTYHVPSTSALWFQYDNNNTGSNTLKTFANYQAAGADVHGTIDTINTSGYPTVNISSPTDQANVTNPVTITATASDTSGITNVKFYVDWVLASTVTSGPYTFNWTNGSFGSHVVAAMALANSGVQSCWAVTLNNTSAAAPAPATGLFATVSKKEAVGLTGGTR
jgi:hypothetical protein